MFFEGTLQEGIAAALAQSKSVVCFITDGQADSQQWEGEYLVDENVRPWLASHAVLLRLEAGSQEEGFLAQLYPIPVKPTIVVVKNAELKEYIVAGVSKDDFVSRLRKSLQAASTPSPLRVVTSSSPETLPQPAGSSTAQQVPSSPEEATSRTSSPGRATSPSSSSDSNNNSNAERRSPVQELFAERAAQIEADIAARKRKAAEEARRKREEEKAKADAERSPEAKAAIKHAEMVKKKKLEEQAERQRILKAINDDKLARAARQAEREKARKDVSVAPKEHQSISLAAASELRSSMGNLSLQRKDKCALQVRLLSGSKISREFASSDTLKDVREWVDKADKKTKGKKMPYELKLSLPPLPPKTFSKTDDDKSLQELGLAPSATLILAPSGFPKYDELAAADTTTPEQPSFQEQANNDNQAVHAKAIACLMGLVAWLLGLIGAGFAFISRGNREQSLPNTTASAASAGDHGHSSAVDRDGDSRIRGFKSAEERRNDQQFYNGNSTNFQPRQDDDQD
ncbi:UBX domain-containing protein 4 [Diplogelasinospora grovesii]|uniref:UBX domain-containing protein 2 n=1 Tax=Diplogelasinospora grovesii TaxID=303347 RepID=A0AAN6NDG3_9PEZI|nr:UBX domain-containing protein 4 [Diplogelasinospora grovesii]